MLLFTLVLQPNIHIRTVVFGRVWIRVRKFSNGVRSITNPSTLICHKRVRYSQGTKTVFYEMPEMATTLTNVCVHPFLHVWCNPLKTLVMVAVHSRIFGLSAVVFVHVLGQSPQI